MQWALVAAGLVAACTAPPAAVRGSVSASPPAEPSTAEGTAITPVPSVSTTTSAAGGVTGTSPAAGPTTTVTFALPSSTTTTTLVLPEDQGADLTDEQWWAGQPGLAPWEICVQAHESATAGGYQAVSSGGTYRGAYQFVQGTWDQAVTLAGHPEWAGRHADEAPAAVQDAAAAALHAELGMQPWAGSGCA